MSTILDILGLWSDEEQAEAISWLLSRNNLGPLTFNALNAHRTSCSNEYIILDKEMKRILLFQRPPHDKFFAQQWHFSGTTLRERQLTGTIWSSVKEKYKLAGANLSEPLHIGWCDVPMGPQALGHNPRGEERGKIHVVLHLGNERPVEGVWFRIEERPTVSMIAHHGVIINTILLPWLEKSR